jgi:hypothetical protein
MKQNNWMEEGEKSWGYNAKTIGSELTDSTVSTSRSRLLRLSTGSTSRSRLTEQQLSLININMLSSRT